jgi:hypothetical protein
MNWVDIGRFLVLAGVVILGIGLLFMVADKLPLGRLPGDIKIGSGKIIIYIPVATCIMLSILLTLLINFFSRK